GVNVTIKGQNDEQHRYVTAHVDTLVLLFVLSNQMVVLNWTVSVVFLGT
ncbi:M42 glutamyl aminopeptidase, partial [Streptococcus pneumoniae 2009]